MPRPIWSGSISFGLVNIPIKLYNAVQKKTLHFNQLHANDGGRIKLKKVCSQDGKEVANEEIIKGFEVAPDQYVTVTSEELEALSPQKSRNIVIEDFVNLADIDPIYYAHSYYLLPEKTANKAYSLLLQAMSASHKVAIGKLILRDKQYLGAVRVAGNIIMLSTMFFDNEVVKADALDYVPEQISADQRELSIALQLIESLSTAFTPEKYHDEYRERVLDMIEDKTKGNQTIIQPAAPVQGKVIDLMSALEASIAEIKKKKPAAAKGRRKKAGA